MGAPAIYHGLPRRRFSIAHLVFVQTDKCKICTGVNLIFVIFIGIKLHPDKRVLINIECFWFSEGLFGILDGGMVFVGW